MPRDALPARAACRLFATRGFAETSLRDIAEGCGISKATLYHYFADKDAIVRPLIPGTTRAIFDHVSERLETAHSPIDRLRIFMVESAACFERSRWAWIASASIFWKDPVERHRDARLVWRDRYEGLLRGILRDGVRAGVMQRSGPNASIQLSTWGRMAAAKRCEPDGAAAWLKSWPRWCMLAPPSFTETLGQPARARMPACQTGNTSSGRNGATLNGPLRPPEIADRFFDMVLKGLANAGEGGA